MNWSSSFRDALNDGIYILSPSSPLLLSDPCVGDLRLCYERERRGGAGVSRGRKEAPVALLLLRFLACNNRLRLEKKKKKWSVIKRDRGRFSNCHVKEYSHLPNDLASLSYHVYCKSRCCVVIKRKICARVRPSH